METSQDVFKISYNMEIRLDTQKFVIETWRNQKKVRLHEVPYDKVHSIILTRKHSSSLFKIGYFLLIIGVISVIATVSIFHGFGFLIASIAIFYAGRNKNRIFVILIRGERCIELPFSASDVITLIEDKVRVAQKIPPEQSIFKVNI